MAGQGVTSLTRLPTREVKAMTGHDSDHHPLTFLGVTRCSDHLGANHSRGLSASGASSLSHVQRFRPTRARHSVGRPPFRTLSGQAAALGVFR